MKGKTWKRWGILCAIAILGMGWGILKAQAVEDTRIYEVTGEQHFAFDAETGMITGYQDAGYEIGSEGVYVPKDNTGVTSAEMVVIPRQIRGTNVKGLTGTFLDNNNVRMVVIPDTIESLGDDVFNGCSKLTAVYVYRTDVSFYEEQVTEKLQQDGELKYIKADTLTGDIVDPTPDASVDPDATGTPDTSAEPDATATPESTATPEPTATPESTASSEPAGTPDTGDHTGETAYFEVIGRGSCAVIPASLQTVGQRTFNSTEIASFEVLEGSEYFKDSGEGGINLPEGVGACLMSLDGTKLYRMAPRFRDHNNSLKYSMPEGIEEVMPYAGQGLGWQHVQVADSVKEIDSYAFYQSGLLGITFTENALTETIGEWAFAYNDNLNIVLPASVQTIGKYCFAYIANRTPDLSKTQITVIPEYAFQGCPNLHTITMPSTLQVIEEYAFADNPNLNEVVFTGETLTSIGAGAFQNCTNMHKIDIPAGITTIEPGTFSGCSNLNTVILPEGLEEIKDEAFSNCQNIHQMVIPSTVTEIADNSFSGSNTQNIDTSQNAYAQSAIGGMTPTPSPTPIVPAPTASPVPGIGYQQTIGKLVYRVTGSATVTLVKPTSKSIATVNIPATVQINGYGFRVTAVSAKAFAGCKKLKKVTIGTNVSSIGKQAFKNCKKLSKIIIKSTKLTKKSVGAGAFKNTAKKATVKVPKKKLKAYKKFLRKKGFGKKVKIKK